MSGRSRIRVLRIIARMNVGGPALQVTGLSQGLDQERFDQRLLIGTVGLGEQDYRELRAPDVEATVIPGLGPAPSPLDDVKALVTIRREIRSFRPHIVHTHTAKAGALGRLAARMTGVPAVVHTFHGHLLSGYFSPRVTQGIALAERTLARCTTRLIAVGSHVRDDLLEAGIGRPTQYSVVAPGVELPAAPAREVARKELGLPEGAPLVAFMGRLSNIKRPDRLLDVFGSVVASYPDAVLAIAGEGTLLDDVRRQAAPFGDRVRFLGWRADVETVLAASDIVLLTSDNEGMPVCLIEAAAAGRASVSTDVGSVAEVLQHGTTGFVTGRDTEALADAVKTLLGDPGLRERMGHSARERWSALFSPDRLVRDIEQLYEEIAQEKNLK